MLPFIFLVVGILAQQTFADEPEAIVGGQDAYPGEFPHQVSLRSYRQHICGGSIISNTKILTAAHCVTDENAPYTNFKVATGTNDISLGTLYSVKSISIHPQYVDSSSASWKNDIAVITLSTPITYNQLQQPIELACSSPPVAGQQSTLSGWGLLSAGGRTPTKLQTMSQSVVSKSECQKQHYGMPLIDGHLCTYNRYGIGACQGDSGGPLTNNAKPKQQIGVTSWVLPCARGAPDVYTNVYYYCSWIRAQ